MGATYVSFVCLTLLFTLADIGRLSNTIVFLLVCI